MKNNKGFTLVEVIVSFAFLMILVIGMLNVVLSIKKDVNEKKFNKEMIEFKELLTQIISDDLIKGRLVPLSVTNFDDVIEYKIINKKTNENYVLKIDPSSMKIIYGKENDEKSYQIPNKEFIEFRDLRTSFCEGYCNNILVDIEDGASDDIYNYFIIKIPYYEINLDVTKSASELEKDTNYGIDIVFPIKK